MCAENFLSQYLIYTNSIEWDNKKENSLIKVEEYIPIVWTEQEKFNMTIISGLHLQPNSLPSLLHYFRLYNAD